MFFQCGCFFCNPTSSRSRFKGCATQRHKLAWNTDNFCLQASVRASMNIYAIKLFQVLCRFEFELLRVWPCWLTFYQWRAEEKLLVMLLLNHHAPHAEHASAKSDWHLTYTLCSSVAHSLNHSPCSLSQVCPSYFSVYLNSVLQGIRS